MESFRVELPGCDVAPPIHATLLDSKVMPITLKSASELG